ncbi:hypothetical protein BBJ28_00019383 [Nothophytophthora sp. Chile5]|nr:hypothetical protein BBJ28_00019383 [Nothophytophthora sp. Chile5]
MQDEFARAVAALEKQVGALSQHNALLTAELRHTQQQQQNWVQEANSTVSTLQDELRGQAANAETAQREAADREQALTHEVAALKSLLQQEQDYWVRHDQATKENVDRLTRQLAEAKADVFQHHDRNQALRREMRVLQSRVDVAVQMNASFEQRLTAVVQEKQQAMQEVENQLLHYKKRLHEKRAQTKYLTEALVRLQEQRESSGNNSSSSNGSSPTAIPSSSRPTARLASSPVPSASTMEMRNQLMTEPTQQLRRVRKRETGLTLPDEIKAAAATVSTSSRLYKSKRLADSFLPGWIQDGEGDNKDDVVTQRAGGFKEKGLITPGFLRSPTGRQGRQNS